MSFRKNIKAFAAFAKHVVKERNFGKAIRTFLEANQTARRDKKFDEALKYLGVDYDQAARLVRIEKNLSIEGLYYSSRDRISGITPRGRVVNCFTLQTYKARTAEEAFKKAVICMASEIDKTSLEERRITKRLEGNTAAVQKKTPLTLIRPYFL